jgi:hypothetical protein
MLTASAAQASPPSCPDGDFITRPGERFALPAAPCTDPEGDTYTIALATAPMHGTVAPDMGTNYYTPDPGYHGTDQFTYTATDTNMEQSASATVRILVDTAPVCSDSNATVESGRQLALPFICDDADGDDLVIFVGDPLHGTLDLSGPEAIYTPAAGYVGQDTIVYDAEDPFGLVSSTVTLTITVTAPAPPQPTTQSTDTTPPALSVSIASQKLKPALKTGLRLRLMPNEGGTATVTVTVDRATARKLKLKPRATGPVKVGGLKATIPSGQSTLAVKLTAKARAAFKKARKVKLLVTVVIRDAAGNRTTERINVTLKR